MIDHVIENRVHFFILMDFIHTDVIAVVSFETSSTWKISHKYINFSYLYGSDLKHVPYLQTLIKSNKIKGLIGNLIKFFTFYWMAVKLHVSLRFTLTKLNANENLVLNIH